MPIIGYKKHFKNFDSLINDTFIIHFNLVYTDYGALRFNNAENSYFDSGDFNLLLEKVFDDFDRGVFKKYDNGILILSICKYIIDNIPNVYYITYENNETIDIYYKEEIINDYNKILNK